MCLVEPCLAITAGAGDRDVRQINPSPAPRGGWSRAAPAQPPPALAADAAVQVAVGRGRSDVELLAAIGAVVVPHHAQLFQDIERAVDGRRGRRRVHCPAALDEFGARDVPVGLLEHVSRVLRWSVPAQAAGVQPVAHAGAVHVELAGGCHARVYATAPAASVAVPRPSSFSRWGEELLAVQPRVQAAVGEQLVVACRARRCGRAR